jgi:hypothetical protein
MTTYPNVSGIYPHLAQVGDLGGDGQQRTEIGVGCLMPWAGKLYVLNYNSHKANSGGGVSLRRIHADLSMEIVPETLGVDGTYTNRFVHFETNQIVIGPHVIDAEHRIRTIEALRPLRVCGTTRHLTDPATLVYVLCMEGELFELNLRTYECKLVAELQQVLSTEAEGRVHFKDCHCDYGRLVVCSNEYFEADWKRERSQGRLAEFDGKTWRILERKPFTCTAGRHGFGGTIFATGWDQASAILKVFTAADGVWRTYRLPKASHCFDHKWQTEWPRIRETEHERFLMDCHGMFYELSPWAYGNRVWGVRPISTHLWVHGDFCSWSGLLALGADNASPSHTHSPTTAEPHSGLWMGKTDDLWNFGKPKGWGGPWWDEPVKAGVPSDPYLLTGFEHKCIEIRHDAAKPVSFDIEIDFHGHGLFSKYKTLSTADAAIDVFPTGLSGHWLRIVPNTDCTASAQLHYT